MGVGGVPPRLRMAGRWWICALRCHPDTPQQICKTSGSTQGIGPGSDLNQSAGFAAMK
jgi:hypothetical protein